MSTIRFEGLRKSYRRSTALDGIDLQIEPRMLTVFCGPPGSGKSVLMRALIGLETPSAGRILIDGHDITGFAPAERMVGYVPQSFALFPHMSVFDNIAYAMRLQGVASAEIRSRVDRAAEILGIGPLLRKKPSELSGGEKQRAAIARGILKNAEIFILDDPLVGLDFKLRERLMEDLKELRAQLGATFLYVTSDSLEALIMADNLVVMDRGRVVQADSVRTVYHDPAHLRAAELVGFPRCNMLAGRLEGSPPRCTSDLLGFPVALLPGEAPAAEVMIAIRPEHITLADDAAAATVTGDVSLVENLGSEAVVYFTVAGHTLVTTVPAARSARVDLGDRVPFAIRLDALLLFDRASGRRVGRGMERRNA